MDTKSRILPLEGYSRIADLAALLSVHQVTIYNWIRAGKAPPSYKVGGVILFKNEDINHWIESHNTTSTDVEGV